MGRTLRLLLTAALIPVVGLAALRQDPHAHGRGSLQGSNWTELIGSMEKMHAAMASIEPSGNSDADFVKLMLPHHQGAVDMARTELLDGRDPQMRRLAQEIITDQESEIRLMQLWLKQHEANSQVPNQTPGVDAGKEQ